ncbi:hypothetical protein [Tuwongella immobilis]|uniref:Lipoprotein n=1 Tax=Tuwongella immobilis TaxID=692036 RepID=A0A6C2YRC1_9BACT|nr:hypothetical protein [Tuwongella immobilis]VIP03907.1 unnamed protein product [Tuwongella immobilis]VTS05181.1 unnamed protein product [Tuwongella immobilis]
MRLPILMSVLLLATGCQNTLGPVKSRQQNGNIDDPFYTISEQKPRERASTAVPIDDRAVTPDSLSGRYGPTGR